MGIPDPVRTSVLALVATRILRAQVLVPDALGLELAMDRVRQYRLSERLPMLAALRSRPRPEHGAWINDARAWWTVLHPED